MLQVVDVDCANTVTAFGSFVENLMWSLVVSGLTLSTCACSAVNRPLAGTSTDPFLSDEPVRTETSVAAEKKRRLLVLMLLMTSNLPLPNRPATANTAAPPLGTVT